MTDLPKKELIDVATWIQEVGWPTESSNTIEALLLYREWAELYPRDPITGVPHGDHLIRNLRISMQRIHSNIDASIITSLLILKLTSLYKIDGIPPQS